MKGIQKFCSLAIEKECQKCELQFIFNIVSAIFNASVARFFQTVYAIKIKTTILY